MEPSEAIGPSSVHTARGGATTAKPWTLRVIDRFVWPELLQANAEKLKRGRILVGTLLVMIVQSFVLLLAAGGTEVHPHVVILAVPTIGSYALALALVRWRRSLLPSVILFCLTVTGVLTFVGLHRDGMHVALGPWQVVWPLFALYFAGGRWAFVMAVAIALEIAVVALAHYTGTVVPDEILGPATRLEAVASISALAVAMWLGRLHHSAATQSHRALLDAHQQLRVHQANMVSVFQSTDDFVCLLDAELRLVAANQAADRALRWFTGVEACTGTTVFDRVPETRRQVWADRFARVRAGDRIRVEEHHEHDGRAVYFEISINPARSETGDIVGFALFGRDVTERVESERKLKSMHNQLVDVSRQAGMAEVATGVLHNVGNALNGVGVTSSLLLDRLSRSKVGSLVRAVTLLDERKDDLPEFLSADERGRKLPTFLGAVARQLVHEAEATTEDVRRLQEQVKHIRHVIGMQQSHARTMSLIEPVRVEEMVDDALRLIGTAFERADVVVERDYAGDLPSVTLDRHRLLQILVNLLSNARHATLASGRADKRVLITLRATASTVSLQVSDNGVGIRDEDVGRIFQQGFTTKKDGHGFGLHSSAVAAAQMGGTLSCHSDGADRGASFTLELPREPRAKSRAA